VTVATAAAAISEASGRHIEYTALPWMPYVSWNDDLARMFEWFDRVGYDADIVGPFDCSIPKSPGTASASAREQDWSAIAGPATPV